MALAGEKVFLVMQAMGHATIVIAVCDSRDTAELHAQNIRERRGELRGGGQNIWIDKFGIMSHEDAVHAHA